MLQEYDKDQQEILVEIGVGNEQAFRQFFDHYSPKINAFASTLTRSQVLAEDIVQEVFTKVWINRKQLAELDAVEAWLVTIAKNIATNMLRRIAHELSIVQDIASIPLHQQREEHLLDRKHYHEKLDRAVQKLPVQQRRVWVMSRRDGIRQREIARELNISVYTVKEYLKKSMVFLKKNALFFL